MAKTQLSHFSFYLIVQLLFCCCCCSFFVWRKWPSVIDCFLVPMAEIWTSQSMKWKWTKELSPKGFCGQAVRNQVEFSCNTTTLEANTRTTGGSSLCCSDEYVILKRENVFIKYTTSAFLPWTWALKISLASSFMTRTANPGTPPVEH